MAKLSVTTRVSALLLALALCAWAAPAAAQDEAEESQAPQILTSDLARRHVLTEDRISVDFVIVDSDNITRVTINGEPQQFTPSDTVLITKEFVFTEDRTVIEVTATDEQGNERTLQYFVFRPGVQVAAEEPGLKYFVRVSLAFEIDDNPSNDLSSPIDIKGVDVEGVVPDDEQEDSRITVQALGGLIGNRWNAFLGVLSQNYAKSENENFNTRMIFLGAGYRFGAPSESSFVVRYLFVDIDIGSFDYSQQHTLTPGFEIVRKDDEGTFRDFIAVDFIVKDFAQSDADDSSQFTLKWEDIELDAAKQDSSRGVLAYGNSTEGFDESEYDFLSYNQDFVNRWDSGFRFDIGWGYEYRNYPNDEPLTTDTPLGDTRVDNLLRFSAGPGWQFNPAWFAKLGYRYVTNISNKSPYVRQIYGITVQGTF